jgi:hypothetical protein
MPRSEEAIRAEAAAALTDDRLSKYAIYLREMIPEGQSPDSGSSVRTVGTAARRLAEERALGKSGLAAEDIPGLWSLTQYYFFANGELREVMDKSYELKYGKAVVEILARHHDEFAELNRQIAAISAKRREALCAQAAAALTDDQLERLVVYEREMIPFMRVPEQTGHRFRAISDSVPAEAGQDSGIPDSVPDDYGQISF